MTANQRRPGFRLPWSSEMDEAGAESESDAPASSGAEPAATSPVAESQGQSTQPEAAAAPRSTDLSAEAPVSEPPPVAEHAPSASPGVEAAAPEPGPAPATNEAPGGLDGGDSFMRELVSAMRRVAEEARDTGLADLRARADEAVGRLESDAERRRDELRARADADVDAVGEWARVEAERIKKEAEQRVLARRAQLEQQLAGETQRTEAETEALRDRVAQYDRELSAYHGQLGQISDPAAFAAAAKRMPKPPELGVPVSSARPATEAAEPASSPPAAPAAHSASHEARVEPSSSGTNGVPASPEPVHPAEEEVLAARLAELDATLPPSAGTAAAVATEAATTEVVVKGLGSFGAITGFRQALSGVDGIDGVALSLGQTGEFVFRATHAAGFDVWGAIAQLEGDAAKVEDRPEGGLRVTLDRAR